MPSIIALSIIFNYNIRGFLDVLTFSDLDKITPYVESQQPEFKIN